MRKIIIKRTNQDDLVFTGEPIASVKGQKKAEDRVIQLQLTLYQTRIKAYVLGITLHDSRVLGSEPLRGAVSFITIDDIHDFLLSEEGRGIADLVLLLLEQVVEARLFPDSEKQLVVSNFTMRANTGLRQTIQ